MSGEEVIVTTHAEAIPMRRSTIKQHGDIRFLLKQRGIPTHFVTDQHHAFFQRAGIPWVYGAQMESTLRATDYEAAAHLIQVIREQRYE